MIETKRLIIDQWCDTDLPHFARINANPEVMRYFPATLSTVESNALAQRMRDLITEKGYGFWALRLKDSGQFIGFTGLHDKGTDSVIPDAPLVEIGWRLGFEFWGNGYASEAARAALEYAFSRLGAESVYSFTALSNKASRRVMEKIGMSDTGKDFNHPGLPAGHHLQRHCLYRIDYKQWKYQQHQKPIDT